MSGAAATPPAIADLSMVPVVGQRRTWRRGCWSIAVAGHRGRVDVAVRHGHLPGAAARPTQAPAALRARWIGERSGTTVARTPVARTPVARTPAILDVPDRDGAVEHRSISRWVAGSVGDGVEALRQTGSQRRSAGSRRLADASLDHFGSAGRVPHAWRDADLLPLPSWLRAAP